VNFRVARVALEDADEAATWYDSRRPKLGSDFLDELDRILERIRENAFSFPQLEYPEDLGEHVRRALLKRFPYIVIFKISADQVTVIAVEHTSRKPGRWLHRLEEDF